MRRAGGIATALTAVSGGTFAGWQLWGRARRRHAAWAPGVGEQHVGKLAVRVAGDDGSATVLLHGLTDSGAYWGGGYDALADDGRLVVPDLLGFGASPRPDVQYSADDHVDAVVAALDEIGVGADVPVVIGGHSLGSLVALRLAARHPGRVRAVVAFGPPLYPDPAAARSRLRSLGPFAAAFALDTPAAHAACQLMCDHRGLAAAVAPLVRPGMPRQIARDSVRHSWESYSGSVREVILAAEGDQWLDAIDVPVRFVIGDRDRVPDRAHLRRLVSERPTRSLDVWLGGHDLPMAWAERAAGVLREVRDGP